MKNHFYLFTCLLLACVISLQAQQFYDLKTKTLDGRDFSFSELKGKKVMIVNTASKCGFTPQYADLEKLYEEYKNNAFIIIGFPSNDFNKQEPGTNEEIKEFCTKNYGVTFPMMQKINVKGKDKDPVYLWLTEKKLNGKMDSSVKWNFQKYLIDEHGNLVDVMYSIEKPAGERVKKWITNQ